jgi:hypothetical protein
MENNVYVTFSENDLAELRELMTIYGPRGAFRWFFELTPSDKIATVDPRPFVGCYAPEE